ncbi:hypothetical protein CVT24_001278 [Panaeolus cyanescens]|uniref:Tubulin-specific chaperone A n=1 Tax=Panaeolus cyanescens TaxID=181874 RepID=A0A409YFZ7_9AGAR|nr:hypothetical protein CVT24_001278 [Panaeolus cyanescens]
MSDAIALRRQLKIKTGVANRLGKEVGVYRKEVAQLEEKRDQLIKDGHPEDEWDVKNTTRMKQESEKMIHDTASRLEAAIEDLRTLIENAKKAGLNEDEELRNAEEALKSVTDTI